jgi:two-component system, NarL family, invasion response regulator UvrY
MQHSETIQVALVDDHKLFRKGMVELICNFSGYTISVEANNGKEFTQLITPDNCPHIALLDINMPEMDGYSTAAWLKKEYPQVKVLALSMYDNEDSIIRMLQCGARGYILKDTDPAELKEALDALVRKGYYYSELVSGVLVSNIHKNLSGNTKEPLPVHLNERETEFLKLACTELAYKEIADRMGVGVRTVDGYREALFEKLQVRNRVGLVLYAIRHGIVVLS